MPKCHKLHEDLTMPLWLSGWCWNLQELGVESQAGCDKLIRVLFTEKSYMNTTCSLSKILKRRLIMARNSQVWWPDTTSSFISPYTKRIYFLQGRLYINYMYKFTVVYGESVNLIGYITVYSLIVNSYTSVHIAHNVWTSCNIIKQFFSTHYLTFFSFYAMRQR